MYAMSCVHRQHMWLLASLLLLTAAAISTAAAASQPQLRAAADDEEMFALPQLQGAKVTGSLTSPAGSETNLFLTPNVNVPISSEVELTYFDEKKTKGNTVDITPSGAVTFTYTAGTGVSRDSFKVTLISAAFEQFEDFFDETKDSFPEEMELAVSKDCEKVTITGKAYTAGNCGADFKYSFQMQPKGGCIPHPSRPCCGHDFKYLGEKHECRPAKNKCDVPEYCREHCSECPKDVKAPDHTPCHAYYQVPLPHKKSHYGDSYEHKESYDDAYETPSYGEPRRPHKDSVSDAYSGRHRDDRDRSHYGKDPYSGRHGHEPQRGGRRSYYDSPYHKTGPYAVGSSPEPDTKATSAAGDSGTKATVLAGDGGDKAATEGFRSDYGHQHYQHKESHFYVECAAKCYAGQCVLTDEDIHKCW